MELFSVFGFVGNVVSSSNQMALVRSVTEVLYIDGAVMREKVHSMRGTFRFVQERRQLLVTMIEKASLSIQLCAS